MSLRESEYVLIHTAVPVAQADAVRKAMAEAGAGKQGNYQHCSGSFRITGRFIPLDGAHPAIGTVGQPATVDEEAIRMICHKDSVPAVINALRAAHPYEDPPIDIFPRLEVE